MATKKAKKITKAQATLSAADKSSLKRIMKKVRLIKLYKLQQERS
jgi:hypothetical protein